MARARLVLAGILLASCPCAFPLNPALDVSQYAHTAWKSRDGFPPGEVHSIAQTSDGYLWLATRAGYFASMASSTSSCSRRRIRTFPPTTSLDCS
jgi:ligand-binding sensor domain-containing protein